MAYYYVPNYMNKLEKGPCFPPPPVCELCLTLAKLRVLTPRSVLKNHF